MAERKYIDLETSEKGRGHISALAFSRIAEESLADLPYVLADKDGEVSKDISIVLSDPVKASFDKSGKPIIDISVKVRRGLNATELCKELQEEVTEQVLSLTEIPSAAVNLHVIGIF